MIRNADVAFRIREVFLNGHWIANTNYTEQLLGINYMQATQQFIGMNTIASLTYHINYYLAGLLHAFKTGRLEISDQFSFNCPPIDCDKEWKILVSDLLLNAKEFADNVEAIEPGFFDEPFLDGKYGTLLRNIEGLIEHSYYHLGQIVLIRKLIKLGRF